MISRVVGLHWGRSSGSRCRELSDTHISSHQGTYRQLFTRPFLFILQWVHRHTARTRLEKIKPETLHYYIIHVPLILPLTRSRTSCSTSHQLVGRWAKPKVSQPVMTYQSGDKTTREGWRGSLKLEIIRGCAIFFGDSQLSANQLKHLMTTLTQHDN